MKVVASIMVLYSFTCLLFKIYDMFGLQARLERVEKVHETKVLMLHDVVKKAAGVDPKNSFEDKEKRAQLVELYYFINIVSLMVCVFSSAACAYLKLKLKEDMILPMASYRKITLSFFLVFAMTGLGLLIVSHKIVKFAWTDVMKWIEILVLFGHMMSENSGIVMAELLCTALLIIGLAAMAVITSKIETTVAKVEKLQLKMDASIQLENVEVQV